MYKVTGPTTPSCEMTRRNKNPSGNKHKAKIGGPSFGTGGKFANSNFEVKHQDPPTPDNPVPQHKNFAQGESY